MAKTPSQVKKTPKPGTQNRRTENNIYQMVCRDCDWKSDKIPFRSSLNLAADMHRRFTKDLKTGKTHRVEMIKVQD
ncbi:MAG TPA: hypothetical protein VFG10_07105 [Saprospiraceae bacterium]|nr:hypothetical protein [Saprospiraceae bacterium]